MNSRIGNYYAVDPVSSATQYLVLEEHLRDTILGAKVHFCCNIFITINLS